jgi:DNA-binding NarL/FixJ family response regulator
LDTTALKKECGEVVKVLIADDHPVVRKGTREILANGIPGVLCGEAENAQEVLNQVQRGDWDLVILDITLPGRSGLDVLKELKQTRPKLPVLMLSFHPEEQYGKRALMAGASGYMNKESAPEDLIRAIRLVLAGRLYVSPKMGESLAAHLTQDPGRPLHESLSDREFEILRLIGSGKTPTEIAEELHLGLTTISTYRARILEKMSMNTTAELMHYALSNRLAD